jgi:DNA-binding transcriptional ArsR family regulator
MACTEFDNRHHALLMALAHPLRRAILRAMSNEEEISPRELADMLGHRLTLVSYHVKVLVRCGAVAPVRNKKVRGATKHFYRWSLKEEWAQRMLDAGEGDTPPRDKP